MDENSIIEITVTGIVYLNENGNRQSIEFATCYEQYLKMWSDPVRLEQVKKVNRMDDRRLEQFLEKVKQRKEIGIRNPLKPPWADGPYIEFYIEPPTRFRFTNNDEYAKIRNAIEDAGWQIFDQS